MSSVFSRSTRALTEDGWKRSSIALLLVVLLLAGWTLWAFRARVAVYASTGRARLEVVRAAHPLTSPVNGRVVAHHLALDVEVTAGQVLVELDAEPQRLELEEERARQAAAQRESEALRRQLAALEQAQGADALSAGAAREAAKSRLREGEETARHAEEKRARLARLSSGGVAGEQELLDAQSAANASRAAAEALGFEVAKLEAQTQSRDSEHLSELEALRAAVARAEGEAAASSAAIARWEHEITRRRILAPVAGRLGDLGELSVGSMVIEGARLAAVVPGGGLRLVAEFEPAAVVGRIRAGQRAWLHLSGFPSIQYGTVPAVVDRVGSELREGRIRVELLIHPERGSRIPLEHGLPGSVEVEVERVSPAALMLRATGQLVGPDRGSSASTPGRERSP